MDFDICIIGGGIVGLATAMAITNQKSNIKVAVIDKEAGTAMHQTGHNSGVIHSGIYYAPGSLKATLCKQGCTATKEFARKNNILFHECGKLIVATNLPELERMQALLKRATENGINAQLLDKNALKKAEPEISGIAALYIESAGIINYAEVCRAMVSNLSQKGVAFIFDEEVSSISPQDSHVFIGTNKRSLTTSYLIACAGLQSDRIATMAGLKPKLRIIPFRGEYFLLPGKYNNLFNHLIYPVPDPDLPFLGIHITKMINGTVTVGPNAVLGLHREGYEGFLPVNVKDAAAVLGFPGTWKLLKQHWRASLSELKDSVYKRGYLEKCRKFYPGLSLSDLMPYAPGIRAQAVRPDGTAEHDFVFLDSSRMTHVLNAPSPAATSAIPIGEMIAQRAAENGAF